MLKVPILEEDNETEENFTSTVSEVTEIDF